MLSRLLWVLRVLMALTLVLVPSGGGRGFAYKAEPPGSLGEVCRGVEKAVGTGKERGGAGLACTEPEGKAARRGAEVYKLGEGWRGY